VNQLKSESVEFSSEGYTLHGVLTRSESTMKKGVVILHPHPLYGGDMKNHVVCALEHVFLDAQFTTLRFDFRGATTSPNGYSGVNGAVTDALNAIEVLKSLIKIRRVGIAGYSFGASTAIRLALLQPPPFLISLSASRGLISEDGFDIEQISSIDCPVLLFHGKSDRMILPDDLDYLTEILGLAPEDSILLEGESHFYQKSLPFVVSTISAFIRSLSV
jgi:alpha/beta superfamily hydrolase